MRIPLYISTHGKDRRSCSCSCPFLFETHKRAAGRSLSWYGCSLFKQDLRLGGVRPERCYECKEYERKHKASREAAMFVPSTHDDTTKWEDDQ